MPQTLGPSNLKLLCAFAAGPFAGNAQTKSGLDKADALAQKLLGSKYAKPSAVPTNKATPAAQASANDNSKKYETTPHHSFLLCTPARKQTSQICAGTRHIHVWPSMSARAVARDLPPCL